MQDKEVWDKIFPLKIGDKVRILSSSLIAKRYKYSFKGLEGEVMLDTGDEKIIVAVKDGKGEGFGYHRLKKTDVKRI